MSDWKNRIFNFFISFVFWVKEGDLVLIKFIDVLWLNMVFLGYKVVWFWWNSGIL